MSKSFAEIQQSLGQLGILTPQELAQILRAAGKDEKFNDPKELAKLLVASGKLTRFQATAIWEGAAASLQFGDYLILDKIGAGGMGHVYKAQHRRMKRILAIKMLHKSSVTSEATLKRFFREVESAAKLNHPNIVTAYDAGEHRGEYYLAMEFVDGKDLAGVLKERGPLPIDQAVNIILQACTGLAYAHDQGMVHRDIKPANLLLARDGTVKILDMGLARSTLEDEAAAASEQSLTMAGKLLGTVEYMSPEQAANPKLAGPQADIYALGCTLFRLLTGNLPYRGSTTMETVMAHQNQTIPHLSESMSGSPLELLGLQQVLEGMMAKKVEDRFQTVNQVVSELTHVVPNAARVKLVMSAAVEESFSLSGAAAPSSASKSSHQPSHISRSGYKGKATPPVDKINPLIYAGLAVAVIAIVCGVIFRPGAKPAAPQPVATAQNTPDAPVSAIAPTPPAPVQIPAIPAVVPAAAAGDSLEILPLMDVNRDMVAGNWELSGDRRQLTAKEPRSRLFLPVSVPSSYRLEFTMRGPPGKDGLAVGLASEGRQFRVALDGYAENRISGLGNIQGKDPNKNDTATTSFQMEEDQDHRVACTVKPGQVQVQVDGKMIIDWQGDMADLSLPGLYNNVLNTGKLFLSSNAPGFVFSNLKLTSLDGSPVTADTQPLYRPPIASAPGNPSPAVGAIDLLPLIKLDQHVLAGQWRNESGAIICTTDPGQNSAVSIPAQTPSRYRLEAQVTRLSGAGVLWMRLPQGSKAFAVGFDNFGDKHLTGPDMIGGKRIHSLPDNGNVHRDFQFVNGQSYLLACTVEPGRLIMQIDDKEVYRFEGDLNTLGGEPNWMKLGELQTPVIGSWGCSFRIDKLRFTSLDSPIAGMIQGEPIDLMTQINPNRDGKSSEWRVESGSLIGKTSDKGSGFFYIPVTCPTGYRLEFKATRLSATGGLSLRLPQGDRDFNAVFSATFASGKDKTGPFMLNNLEMKDIPNLPDDFRFVDGKPFQIACTVVPGHFSIQIDGREIYQYQGDLNALGGNPGWLNAPPRHVPMLIISNPSEFRFEKLELIPLQPRPPTQLAEGKPVDLMPLIDPARDKVSGEWKKEGDALISPEKTSRARLKIPVEVPPYYQLTGRITLLDDKPESANFGLVAGDRQCLTILQGYGANHVSGLETIDGKAFRSTQTAVSSLVLERNKSYQVTMTVKPGNVAMQVDGRTIIDWKGDFSRLGVLPEWTVSSKPMLFLASYASYRFENLTLTPLEPKATTQLVEGPSVDLLKQIDPNRDSPNQTWKLENGALVSDPRSTAINRALLKLPAAVPSQYRLDMEIAAVTEGNRSLDLRIPFGSGALQATFDGWHPNHVTGLSAINGKNADKPENPTRSTAFSFEVGKPVKLSVTVADKTISAIADGKPLYSWTGDNTQIDSAFFKSQTFNVYPASDLLITGMGTSYRITKLTLTPLVPAPETPEPEQQQIVMLPDTSKTVKLMPLLEAVRDTAAGEWEIREGMAFSPGKGGNSTIQLPVDVPAAYQLTARVHKLNDAPQPAVLGLVAADQQCLMVLCGAGNQLISGLSQIRGLTQDRNETATSDLKMVKGGSYLVTCTVQPGRISVDVDGKRLVDWRGDFSRLSIQNSWKPADLKHLFLASTTGGKQYAYSDITLTPLAPHTELNKPHLPVISNLPWTNLLAMVDVSQDANGGKWRQLDGGLQVEGAKANRLALPVSPVGSYELKLKFKRLSGSTLGVHLPAGDQSLLLSLGQIIGGAPVIGLGNIDGKSAIATGNPTRSELPPIQNNIEHTLNLQVIRKESDLQVAVMYDDQPVIDWTGSPGAISTFKEFAPADPGRPGLFSNGSKILFTDVQFRMLQGEANLMHRAVASNSAAMKKAVPEYAKTMMAMPGPAPKIAKIQRNQRVDLTKASIVPKDGKWELAAGRIGADGRGLNDPTWARIPLRPGGSYEISFTFQNKDPDSEVRILLPLGPKGCALWVFTPNGSGFVDMSGRDWKQNRLTTYVNLQSGNAAVYKFKVDIGSPIITVSGDFIRDNTHFHPSYTFSADELIPYSDDTTMALGIKGGRIAVRDFRIQGLSD